jgi:hypothetical protein
VEESEGGVPHMAEGGLVYSPVQTSRSGDIDPETGLPFWMLEQRRKQSRSSNPNPEPAPTPTGLQQTPDKWSAKDILKYSSSRDSVGSQIGRGIVSTVVPLGGLVMKAQDKYLSNKLPSVAEQLLKAGKNPDGSQLSDEDRKGLQSVIASQSAQESRKPGLLSRLLKQPSEETPSAKPTEQPKPKPSKSIIPPRSTTKEEKRR